ncbi:MAG: glycosyltransferase [Flavobacteriaceae bacterium]|nr:glycosyltransferase [Flavobacteriaceae bacterium]
MKIYFFLYKLQRGGAENVFLRLANYAHSIGYDVELITFFYISEDFNCEEIKVNVKVIPGNSLLRKTFNFCGYIKRTKPQVIYSTLYISNLINSFTSLFQSHKSIIRPTSISITHSLYKEILFYFIFNITDKVICSSEDVYHSWLKYAINKDKFVTIPNPSGVIAPFLTEKKSKNSDCIKLVTISRASPSKRIDFLISVLHYLVMANHKVHLGIIGTGFPKKVLGKQEIIAQKLIDSGNLIFYGKINNPKSVLLDADIYVTASEYEGFNNSLLEALCLGIPIVGIKSPGNLSQIVGNNEYGLIVNDYNKVDFAESILKVKSIKYNKQSFFNKAQNYDISKILDCYLRAC